MSDAVRLVDAAGAALAPPLAVQVAAGGFAISMLLPDARRLRSARMLLGATGDAAAELSPAPAIDSDAFTIGSDGKPDTRNATAAHWLSVSWGQERAITGLTIGAAAASSSKPASGARVRMYSAGNWLPLPARDTLAFAGGAASARFPACAASRLMIDLLSENQIGGNWTGVAVPGAVNLSNVSVSVQATPQPCAVSLAVADDAPFFAVPGPLPAAPVAVDGLVRAVNRYLGDHPGALSVPLTLRAAAPAAVRIAGFDAQQEPAPSVPGDNPSSPPPPRPEQPGTGPTGDPQRSRGRWCDPRHGAAQGFAPTPPGKAVSAVELFVRATGQGGSAAGSLALHADDAGRPAETTLLPLLRFQLTPPAAAAAGEDWLRCELPLPASTPAAPWWAVLRVDQGELLWYLGDAAPEGAGQALHRIDGGAWLPADPQPGRWLQARLKWLDPQRPRG